MSLSKIERSAADLKSDEAPLKRFCVALNALRA
jgi:hypothetical protein